MYLTPYLISKWFIQKKYVSLQFCNYAARKRIDLFFLFILCPYAVFGGFVLFFKLPD